MLDKYHNYYYIMIHQNNITDLIRYCVKINKIWIVVVVSKISVYQLYMTLYKSCTLDRIMFCSKSIELFFSSLKFFISDASIPTCIEQSSI